MRIGAHLPLADLGGGRPTGEDLCTYARTAGDLGYSTLAANAALCAVPANIWPAFHARLFAEQPAEGSAGLTAAQLSAIGTSLGAGPVFTQCVEGNGNAAAITAATAAASANPALQTDGQFGTPTIAVGGRKIDVSDSDWLQTVLAAG